MKITNMKETSYPLFKFIHQSKSTIRATLKLYFQMSLDKATYRIASTI